MSLHDLIERPVERPRGLGVSWPTIALFAVVTSYVDGFWVASLQGAVGSFERSRPPFERWLRDSTLMLPLYTAAVLLAVLLARRWFGQSPRAITRGGTAAVLIVAACTLLGVAEVANSSAYDYRLQTQHLQLVDRVDDAHVAASEPSPTVQAAGGSCVGVCAAKESTLRVHVRAVGYASGLLLLTNLVVVGWLLAVGGDRLWEPSAPTGRREMSRDCRFDPRGNTGGRHRDGVTCTALVAAGTAPPKRLLGFGRTPRCAGRDDCNAT